MLFRGKKCKLVTAFRTHIDIIIIVIIININIQK